MKISTSFLCPKIIFLKPCTHYIHRSTVWPLVFNFPGPVHLPNECSDLINFQGALQTLLIRIPNPVFTFWYTTLILNPTPSLLSKTSLVLKRCLSSVTTNPLNTFVGIRKWRYCGHSLGSRTWLSAHSWSEVLFSRPPEQPCMTALYIFIESDGGLLVTQFCHQ